MVKIENFDIRVYERKLRKGEITKKEYDDYIASVKECNEEEDFVEIDEETVLKNAGIKKHLPEEEEERGKEDEQEKL